MIQGKPTGSIRVSFGWMSTRADIEAFLKFVHLYFIEKVAPALLPPPPSPTPLLLLQDYEKEASALSSQHKSLLNKKAYKLTHVIVYPIKSCKGVLVQDKWPLTDCGLLYDREWTIIDDQGFALQQKKYPIMGLIEPQINVNERLLIVKAPSIVDSQIEPLKIKLDEFPTPDLNEQLNVCGHKYVGGSS